MKLIVSILLMVLLQIFSNIQLAKVMSIEINKIDDEIYEMNSRFDAINQKLSIITDKVSSIKNPQKNVVYVSAILYGAEGGDEDIVGCRWPVHGEGF